VVKDNRGGDLAAEAAAAFEFTPAGGGWEVGLREGASLAPGAYTLWLNATDIIGGSVSTAKGVKLTVAASKAKLEQSAKTVTLYRDSAFNQAVVGIYAAQGMPGIAAVELRNTRGAGSYELLPLGAGRYLVRFRDGEEAGAKSATLTLDVTMEGNEKPAAQVKIAVKVESF
jgi:hypothetical protein